MQWKAFLGDEFFSSPEMLLPFLVVVGAFAAAQILRILNGWLVEKVLDSRLAVAALSAHCLILFTLWQLHYLGAILLYLLALTVVWVLAPLLELVREHLVIKRFNQDDIARYKYHLKVSPSDANARINLANAYLECGRREDAIAEYERAVALDPQHTGIASHKLRTVMENRTRRDLANSGLRDTVKEKGLINLDERISMEVMSGEDAPSIPEL